MEDLNQQAHGQNAEQEQPSYLAMSDEEWMNLDPSSLPHDIATLPDEGNDAEEEEDGGEAEDGQTEAEDNADNTDEADDAEDAGDGQAEDGNAADLSKEDGDEGEDLDQAQAGTGRGESETSESTDDAASNREATATQSGEIDYKAEYEKVFRPFKANGKDITVQSADDVVALMQMGANYNKKMAALKPNLRLLKLLENHNLLDEQKLSYLIDLDKKNPDAINKLVQDSGIDPMDLDAEKAKNYVPNVPRVSDNEVELDEVLADISDTPTFNRLHQVVTKDWDKESRGVFIEKPAFLKVINSHMEAGIYDVVMQEVERERMFGRLSGLSDFEAYRQVGDAIHARGGFAHLGRQGQQAPTQRKVVDPNPKQDEDSKLRSKKRAASASKPAIPSRKPAQEEFNPLAMSDEEYEKLMPKFL